MERMKLQITNMEKKFDKKIKTLQHQQSMQPSHISHIPSETLYRMKQPLDIHN